MHTVVFIMRVTYQYTHSDLHCC